MRIATKTRSSPNGVGSTEIAAMLLVLFEKVCLGEVLYQATGSIVQEFFGFA